MPDEVKKWLNEEAYAVKGKDYYYIKDFPENLIPDRLEIPMTPKRWGNIKEQLEEKS